MNKLIESLLQARLSDPFGLLGPHRKAAEWSIKVYEPYATHIELLNNTESSAFKRIHPAGVFEWRGKNEPIRPYRLRMHYGSATHEIFDPYQFLPHISQQDLYLFSEGKLRQGYRMLGSHVVDIDNMRTEH